MSTPADGFNAFDEQASRLEAHIADAERRGDPVPEEARAMLASLRELTKALEGLRGSIEPEEPSA